MSRCYREVLNQHRQHMQQDAHIHYLSDLIPIYMQISISSSLADLITVTGYREVSLDFE